MPSSGAEVTLEDTCGEKREKEREKKEKEKKKGKDNKRSEEEDGLFCARGDNYLKK